MRPTVIILQFQKSNMAAAAILKQNEKFSSQTREIEKRAYYQNYCIDSSQFQLFQRNLAG